MKKQFCFAFKLSLFVRQSKLDYVRIVPGKIVQNKDTIFLHGDSLFIRNDSIEKKKNIQAYFGVKIYNKDIQSVCDSMAPTNRKSN